MNDAQLQLNEEEQYVDMLKREYNNVIDDYAYANSVDHLSPHAKDIVLAAHLNKDHFCDYLDTICNHSHWLKNELVSYLRKGRNVHQAQNIIDTLIKRLYEQAELEIEENFSDAKYGRECTSTQSALAQQYWD